ncbi:unnamed protein product [Boreogadus saida]
MEASCACVGHLCTPDPRNVAGRTTLKRDNSPPDGINTVPSPIADAGLARNGHPPLLPSPIDDDLQPHLSHSHNNNSSPNDSSLCDFPAEFKKLEYVGIKLASVSMIASPGHGHRLFHVLGRGRAVPAVPATLITRTRQSFPIRTQHISQHMRSA